MKRRSITGRLALLFALVSGAMFLALGLYLAHAIEKHFQEMDALELSAAVERVVQAAGAAPALDELRPRLRAHLPGHAQAALWVARENGERLAWDAAVPLPGATGAAAMERAANGPHLFLWRNGESLFRGMATRVPVAVAGEPALKVWAAVNIDHHERFLALVARALWIAVGAAILLSVALGALIARSGTAPVRVMAAHAHRISTDRLDERIDTRDLPQELLVLAEAFNDMLARLQEAFGRLSEFSSDIAHELRTPVNNLLTQTQVTLSKTRSPEIYRDVLASNAEELERLARMVADMLFLAKAENGWVVPHRERVDLAEVARDLFEFYDALAEEKGVTLSLEGEAVVDGDRLMLRRAVNNLLSNAIRHTPSGGRIVVRLAETPTQATASVFNSGEPIEDDLFPKLFERFYRADLSRHRNSDGAGLGLAITRSIVQAHGGALRGHGCAEGNSFELSLPK